MVELYLFWVSLNPGDPVDLGEFFELYFHQDEYLNQEQL